MVLLSELGAAESWIYSLENRSQFLTCIMNNDVLPSAMAVPHRWIKRTIKEWKDGFSAYPVLFTLGLLPGRYCTVAV